MGPGLRCHGARPAAAQHAHTQSASQEAAKSSILHAHKKNTDVCDPPSYDLSRRVEQASGYEVNV